jgi:thiol:disulfide interchange protein
MKKVHLKGLTLLVLFFSVFTLSAQILNPISWKFSQKQIDDSEYVLNMHATIPAGWHVFSQFEKNSTPTEFKFTASPDYILKDKVNEGKPVAKYEEVLKDTARYFLNEADFTQIIIVRNKKGFIVTGNVYFQSCNESSCLPPKQVDFTIAVPASTADSSASGGYWGIFFLGLGIGLAALFTPCVFPMIPLTVSFFLKKNSTKKKGMRDAITYGVCIVVIYVALAAIITAIFGPSGLNAIASNGWVNLCFFLIFVVFGISLLGAFEITLPSSWGNKADSASERGGIIGIFFMALTLCIISFSCTGPFLGALLAGATNSQYWSLIVGMFSFSFALALPFVLFAIFPSWLTSLPQSGGWLNSVKVVFGLFELAFALKFLSTADLVGLHIKFLHFHINGPMGLLRREIFLILWIVIFAIMGFYLLGKIKFSHDSELKSLSAYRVILAIIAFSFSLYLVPGLFGGSLRLIGGFPPPSFYSEGWGIKSMDGAVKTEVGPKNNRVIGCPLNLNCYHDYDEAVAESKRSGKPIMIDFTGFSCVNCRKMEENVWSEPRVLAIIKNDYVLVSLYVDDKTELPLDKQSVSKLSGQKIETYGDKWSDMETTLFKSNTQPLYALVDADGSTLVPTRGYTPDIEQYLQFLTEGKKNFHPLFGKPVISITP